MYFYEQAHFTKKHLQEKGPLSRMCRTYLVARSGTNRWRTAAHRNRRTDATARISLTATGRERRQSPFRMANATLESFNAFLTDRLTAAAVDIFGFVEKAVTDYQEEVYRTKLENQRLQRLLDLVYKPEIRLRRAGTLCCSASHRGFGYMSWIYIMHQKMLPRRHWNGKRCSGRILFRYVS